MLTRQPDLDLMSTYEIRKWRKEEVKRIRLLPPEDNEDKTAEIRVMTAAGRNAKNSKGQAHGIIIFRSTRLSRHQLQNSRYAPIQTIEDVSSAEDRDRVRPVASNPCIRQAE